MLKRLVASLCLVTSLAGPVLAQTCEPAKLAEAVDRYALEPFSARTWRVLQGLGDPMIAPGELGADVWSQQDRWKKLAAEIAPEAEQLQNMSWGCRIAYPLSVLENRASALGKTNPYVKQWLLSQAKVMEACASEGADDIVLPPPLETADEKAKSLQAADRAYQEASIAFYRNKERALPLFKAIGETDSEHRAAARYNTANLLANAKKLTEAKAEANAILNDPALASVHTITRELLGYIANLEDTAEGWTELINRNVAVIETPADKILASPDLKTEYGAALYDIDFAGVRAKESDWWLDGTLPENPTISKALVDTSRQKPMVLWMMAGQSANQAYVKAPWGLIGDKWKARMTSYVDRVSAIQPAGAALGGDALLMLDALRATPELADRFALWTKAKEAMTQAQASCGSDAKTAAAGFLLAHAVRVSAMSGKFEEAYAGLETVPFKTARAYTEHGVLKLAEFLAGEGNVAELRKLRDRLITPEFLAAIPESDRSELGDAYAEVLALAAEDEDRFKQALQRHSDPASNILLNFLPTKKLWAYADDPSFGDEERALFARAAWTRDLALGRKIASERTAKLHELNPAIKEIAAKVDTDYPKTGPERRRLLTILRSPRHNILVAGPTDWRPESLKQENFVEINSWDHNDKNWWCPLEVDRQLSALRQQTDQALGTRWFSDYWIKRLEPVFDQAMLDRLAGNRDAVLKQHPMTRQIGWKEVRALSSMAQAPRYLAEAAVRWGKASKGDDGAPEALALAVKATRYGCNWHGRHGRYSKAAQQLLTTKFKETSWAAQTPYWFDCMRREYDEQYNKIETCKPMTWPKQKPIR